MTHFFFTSSLLFRYRYLLDILTKALEKVALSLDASAFASVSVGSAVY